jgi:REP element-mobilizing transposase RayT
VHVTYRVRNVMSLRDRRLTRALMSAIARSHKRWFRIVHYSIQTNHLHLIVEADSKRCLSRGMQGFAIRGARLVNEAIGREGKLWDDRYHARALMTPTETRHALRYVLTNHRHHGGGSGFDFWSSGPWFGGWATEVVAPREASPAMKARTWLLEQGWRRAGARLQM